MFLVIKQVQTQNMELVSFNQVGTIPYVLNREMSMLWNGEIYLQSPDTLCQPKLGY